MAGFTLQKKTQRGFDEVLARLPELLQAEGFGVLTRIDVKDTLKQKLGVDFRRYTILGACNPGFAHQALSADLIPARLKIEIEREWKRLKVVAEQVRERLERVVARVP